MVTQGPMLVMVLLLITFEEKEPQSHLAEGLAGACNLPAETLYF